MDTSPNMALRLNGWLLNSGWMMARAMYDALYWKGRDSLCFSPVKPKQAIPPGLIAIEDNVFDDCFREVYLSHDISRKWS